MSILFGPHKPYGFTGEVEFLQKHVTKFVNRHGVTMVSAHMIGAGGPTAVLNPSKNAWKRISKKGDKHERKI